MKYEWKSESTSKSYVSEETSREGHENYRPFTIDGARWRGPFEGYR